MSCHMLPCSRSSRAGVPLFAGVLGLAQGVRWRSQLAQAAGPSLHAPPEQILIDLGRLVKTNGLDAAAGRRAGSTQARKRAHQRRSTFCSATTTNCSTYGNPLHIHAWEERSQKAPRPRSKPFPGPHSAAFKPNSRRSAARCPSWRRSTAAANASCAAAPRKRDDLQPLLHSSMCSCRAQCPAAVQPSLDPGMYCCKVTLQEEPQPGTHLVGAVQRERGGIPRKDGLDGIGAQSCGGGIPRQGNLGACR